MLRQIAARFAALRRTRRRWLVAVLVTGLAVLSAWVSLELTPPASVRLGVVRAEIKAAPGSGTGTCGK